MRARVDGVEVAAFGGACAFVACLYLSPATLFPALEPLRPALLGAVTMIGGVCARRAFRGTSIAWTGGIGWAMLSLFALAGASALWAFEPTDARAFFAEAIKLAAAYFGITSALSTPARIRAAMRLAAVASVVPAIGTIQRHADGIGLVEGYRGSWLGLLANPNQLSMVMAVTMPWTLSEALKTREIKRWCLFTVLGLQAWCIVVTYSRGGALGMAVGLVAFAAFARDKGRALLIVLAASVAVLVLAPRSFWERTGTIGEYAYDASAQGRIRAWETGLKALREHPLLGIGAGGYLHAWDRYQPRNVRERAYTSHNMWMQVTVELGLCGLAAFTTMFALMLRGLWRARRDADVAAESRALMASFVALLVCGTTGGYAFNWFFYMALGLSGAVVAASRVPRSRRIDGLQLRVA